MDQNNGLKKNNGLGVASFVLSLVGLLIFGIPCGILAIIFGAISMFKFNPETQKNKWMGVAGLIIGIVDIVSVVLFIPMLFSNLL